MCPIDVRFKRSRSQCIDYWKWFLAHNCFPFTSNLTHISCESRTCPINAIRVKKKLREFELVTAGLFVPLGQPHSSSVCGFCDESSSLVHHIVTLILTLLKDKVGKLNCVFCGASKVPQWNHFVCGPPACHALLLLAPHTFHWCFTQPWKYKWKGHVGEKLMSFWWKRYQVCRTSLQVEYTFQVWRDSISHSFELGWRLNNNMGQKPDTSYHRRLFNAWWGTSRNTFNEVPNSISSKRVYQSRNFN